MEIKKITLKKGKEASPLRFHRWIFSGAIQQAETGIREGDLVDVSDAKGKFIARGYFNDGAISVKILSFAPEEITPAWFEERIRTAMMLRDAAGLNTGETNCYRLINAEADGIPGLIIDMYNGNAVLQIHTRGIYRFAPQIAEALKTVCGESLKGIYSKLPEKSRFLDDGENSSFYGDAAEDTVLENGLRFNVNWQKGQKTGFFLDQRDNRRLLGKYCSGKSVLNTFCYTGGFSVYAMANGATQVDSVDYSQWAIDEVEKNIALNGMEAVPHRNICGDALQFLSENEKNYDVIILDPPAFAKSKSARHNAIQAYKRINLMAMKKIKPGGVLFTFSCSQVVDKYTFLQTVLSAAIEAGREVKILHYLSQPADHPVSIFHPESEYLKGLAVHVGEAVRRQPESRANGAADIL